MLISSGMFDPKPIGTLQRSATPGTFQMDAGSNSVQWFDLSVNEAGSVRGTAVYHSGEKDIVYGIAVGKPTHYVQVVISPVGYVAIEKVINTQHAARSTQHLLPYQPWPHVLIGNVPNEIWVDWEDGQLTVRINRELLWMGDIEIDPVDIGIVGESYGKTAVVDFQTIELFQRTKK